MSYSPTDQGVGTVAVAMPQMGVSVAEGTVVQWLKQPGDWVEADETICEISTDKIDTEVPSPATGRLQEVLVAAGETVPVGETLARIATGDPRNGDARNGDARNGDASAGDAGRRRYSPVVRRIAAEHHLDLDAIAGTGLGGRVRKQDVLAALERHALEPPEPPGAPEPPRPPGAPGAPEPPRGAPPVAPPPAPLHTESPYVPEPSAPLGGVDAAGGAAAGEKDGGAVAQPLSRMRRAIGEHMLRSLQTAAHCTTIVEVDMSRVALARAQLGLTYLPFVARAVIAGLREFPQLNATLDGEMLTTHREVHLGVAVSLGADGLIVPVVRDAQLLSAEGLGARIAELAQRARAGALSPDDVRGATFTITNPGAFGAIAATPIINQPQVAILDLEAVVKRPVVIDDGAGGDAIAIRPMANLCLSWDHRALDGALAAQFLGAVRRHVEAMEVGS